MGEIGILTPDGTTMVPDNVRRRLGLKPGSQIEWHVENGQATVRLLADATPAADRPRGKRLVDLAGCLGDPLGRPVSVEEMDEAIAEAVAEDDARISREWREGRG